MAASRGVYGLLLKRDSKILFLFALYGLVAGIITYVDSTSYDENDVFSSLSFVMNYPSFLVLLYLEWEVANPNGFSILSQTTLVLGSVAVWSGIGLVVYAFVKMFKLGS